LSSTKAQRAEPNLLVSATHRGGSAAPMNIGPRPARMRRIPGTSVNYCLGSDRQRNEFVGVFGFPGLLTQMPEILRLALRSLHRQSKPVGPKYQKSQAPAVIGHRNQAPGADPILPGAALRPTQATPTAKFAGATSFRRIARSGSKPCHPCGRSGDQPGVLRAWLAPRARPNLRNSRKKERPEFPRASPLCVCM
jgi:hypothetical protein